MCIRDSDQAVRDWLCRIQAAGIRVMILSNNRSPRRVEQFCRDLGITYVGPVSYTHLMDMTLVRMSSGLSDR